MSKIERLQPECPPDAHKVIRPPENKVNATLVIKIADKKEFLKYNSFDVCETLALFSEKPIIYCDDEIKALILEGADEAEIKPSFLKLHDDNTASIEYIDGAISSSKPFYDLADSYKNYDKFLEKLVEDCYISVNTLSMLILRSISTVYPWDVLLAGDFVRQYISANDKLTNEDLDLFLDIRYGRIDPFTKKDSDPDMYNYLRLERKLFLQYPTEDD